MLPSFRSGVLTSGKCSKCEERAPEHLKGFTFVSPIKPRRFLGIKSRPMLSQRYHEGTHDKSLAHSLDFVASSGAPVYAAKSGIVADCAGHFREGGLEERLRHKANFVCLRHENGQYYSRYFHLSSVVVHVGKKVEQGELIGYVGNTGHSSGPHLHFDVVDVCGVDLIRIQTSFDKGKSWRSVKCVPLSFSSCPEKEITLTLRKSQPFDLSTANVEEDAQSLSDLAILCERGTNTFLEKAQNALKMNARCLLIVDNDSEMEDAMPFVVGDASVSTLNLIVLFLSYSERSWITKLLESENGLVRLNRGIATSPRDGTDSFAKPRTLPCRVTW